MNQSAIQNKLKEIQSPNRPPSLTAAAAFLLFSEMRLDPLNPNWPGGDCLLYSERFADVVQDAYKALGCPPQSIPPAGVANLETCLRNGSSSRRIFCLIDSGDAPFMNKQAHPRIAAFCSEPPVDTPRWNVQHVKELTLESLGALFRSHRNNSDKPLWIVAPITGTLLIDAKASTNLPAFSDRMSRLGTETAFSVLAQVNQLRAQGRDIVSFGLGEPDFDTPEHIRNAAKRALDQGYTHYGPSAGLPELRQAIAQYIQRTRRIPVDPEEVVVTPGAKPIVFDVMMSLLNPGDEILYPNPGYPIYESVADWIGARTVPLPLLESQNWNFSVDQLAHRITTKTRMIVINTPGNPTGTLLGESELREIARLAIDRNLWVIADEVYSQIVFNGEFNSLVSIPGMKERTIIIDGFSKTYAMTGWRLGYGVMNRSLAERVAQIETNIDSCTCSFSQIAGTQALLGPQNESQYMVGQFKERSQVIVDGLNAIEGVRCLPAQGAFYVFPNVTGACRRLGMQTANDLQKSLLEQAGVAVLPRTCFGRRNEGEDQEYIRLSFATSMENIREGLRRMKQFIER